MICKSFCDIDFSGICDKYCFKIITLCPQLRCFFKSHDEEGSGQTVTGQTVIPDNGDRPQATVSRMAGGRIHDMPVGTASLFKIAFIPAGSDDCLIINRDNHHGHIFFRIADRDFPEAAVWFRANGLHIAAKIQKGRCDTLFPQESSHLLSGKAFSGTSKIYFHPGRKGDYAGCYIILYLVIVYMG